jgi:hypothetical protein
MLLVTTAPNDDPLYKALLPMGDVARMPIPHGDVFWSGPWAGAGVSWCGDRKKTGDLLGCIESGHHIQQVEDALQAGINNICTRCHRNHPRHTTYLTWYTPLLSVSST